jgi:hypothetical protein
MKLNGKLRSCMVVELQRFVTVGRGRWLACISEHFIHWCRSSGSHCIGYVDPIVSLIIVTKIKSFDLLCNFPFFGSFPSSISPMCGMFV